MGDIPKVRSGQSRTAAMELRKVGLLHSQNASSISTGNVTAAPIGTPANRASSTASTPTTRDVDWTRLSPRGGAIMRTIVIPLSVGYSTAEIASTLGTSSSWVLNR